MDQYTDGGADEQKSTFQDDKQNLYINTKKKRTHGPMMSVSKSMHNPKYVPKSS